MIFCNFVLHIANIIMVRLLSSLFFCLLTIICTASAEYIRLDMPNRDQLQTENILCIIQDSEGCIWYGTEGDGVYRDDGRHIDVFRNDAQNPSLIGSNNIASLAETDFYIIIGTFHGAYALHKQDFSISCITEVDDNRVDDILVSRKGEIFITANKKIFVFDKKLKFKFSSPSKWHGQDVYIARLFETENNIIIATQWNGGLVRFDGKQFTEMPWNINAQPTNIAETGQKGKLWIGTVGQGIVLYQIDNGTITLQPETGNTICIDLKLSEDKQKLWMTTMNDIQLFENRISLTKIDLPENLLINDSLKLNRLATDKQGRILAACDQQHSFAIAEESQKKWSDIALGNQDSTLAAITDSIARNIRTATHAEAIIYDGKDNVWFSTGRDVRCMSLKTHKETTVLDIADISALAIMPDKTLWLASIYGALYCYQNGKLQKDDYGSNENGDGIVQLLKFDNDNLLLVHNRYERIYNTKRKTLRQQSIEEDGTYSIELLETKSGERWNRPNSDIVIEQLPGWMTSWWMICIYILLSISFILFIIQYYYLHRQRNIFLQNLKEAEKKQIQEHTDTTQEGNNERERWINKAIECVEQHLGEENYSVEQLSCDLCMSRMTLYRKIQGATGQKPTDFIRTIRLSHAARMLLKGEMTISEISDATGFSSVSHFSRSFRSMYGVSPREYRKQTL